MIKKNKEPTSGELNDIAETYVDNNKALQKNFSPTFLKKYKEKCMRQLEMYNKLSFDERVKKILKYWKTFDNYSLSIMYLKFIHFINTNGYTDNKFIIHFTELLLQNIDPNTENRLDISDTIQKFNGFLTQDIHVGIKVFKDFKKNFIDGKKDIDKVLKKERKTGKIESLKIRKS